MNHEGYKDPTADIAVNRTDREKMPQGVWQIFTSIRTLLHPLGLSIDDITLYDRTTGRHYHWRRHGR